MSRANPLKVVVLRVYYRLLNWWAWRRHAAPDLQTRDIEIPGDGSTIPARIYESTDTPRAVIIYIHGGGWVLGDLKTHDPFCRRLAQATDCRVIALDYRRAPEHPFPSAAEDCLAATDWVLANPDAGDSAALPLFVCGDSAGGNLSAVIAQQRPGRLQGQVLIYPTTEHYSADYPSYEENATGYGLTRKLMTWFWDSYLYGSPALEAGVTRHPLATPAFNEMTSLVAPALVITAGLDPLRDEGIAYAQALGKADVHCEHLHYPEAMHGFLCSEGPVRDHRLAMERIVNWLDSPG